MKWKILLTDGLAKISDQALLDSVELVDRKGITAEELLEEIDPFDAVIVRGRTKITDAVLNVAKNLKVVGRMGVGVDNIDLKAARSHGVTVVNAPVATTVSVAELTLGLMLSLIRGIPKADSGMKAGNWLKKQLRGTELYQKTLGVIGFGHIGESVAKRAMAFDMRVIAFDPIRSEDEIKAVGAEPVSFEICAARGGVIDEQALLAALESGKVAGAALDVYESEPPGTHSLPMHPNVIGTPHIGAQTKEAQLRAGFDILSEVVAALDQKPLRWKIV